MTDIKMPNVGDALTDMHGNTFGYLKEGYPNEYQDRFLDKYEILDAVDFTVSDFHNTLRTMLPRETCVSNKMVYVTDINYDGVITVAYSYDGRRAGVAKLRLKEQVSGAIPVFDDRGRMRLKK